MCGIFGLIPKDKTAVSSEILGKALHLLAHRGPDGQGIFQDGSLGLAHTRLAIFDISDSGRQPMHYRHYTIVFNGAIYNFPELRKELCRRGYSFRTNTDTEVIPAAYDCWGEACLHRFNGMWAFAIYDSRRQRLFCSRDRFGIRPFYYLDDGSHFAFASEVKAFGAVPGHRFRLNAVRAYEFLAYGWQDHTQECMVENIRPLPPGCFAIFNLDTHRLEIRCYYQLEEQICRPEEKTFAGRQEQFRELFKDSVRLRLRADVPVALSLSGGMDSSSVLAVQNDLQPGKPLDCFSVVFPGTASDEEPFVDAMATRYQAPLRKIIPSFQDIASALNATCWHQDEPIASAAVIAHYRMMQHIRQQGFKVMLNGQGADEILGGYDKFYWPFFKELARAKPWKLPAEILGLLLRHPSAFSRTRRLWQREKAPPIWLHPDFVPPAERLFRRSREENLASCSRNLIREVGLPVLLHYEDRSAMASGVESRLPFMDHRLVEYSLGLPAEDKIHYGVRKYALRRAMEGMLPKAVLNRYAKMGFPTPQMEWMEQHPAFFLNRLEALTKKSGIFTDGFEDKARAALRNGERGSYPVVWRGVAFGEWWGAFL